jgi:hypothetical protein
MAPLWTQTKNWHVPSSTEITCNWRSVIACADITKAYRRFSQFSQDSKQVSAIRAHMRRIIKLAKVKASSLDSSVFLILGRSTQGIKNIYRSFCLFNSRANYDLFNMRVMPVTVDRYTVVTTLISCLAQCISQKQSMFFINSLLAHIHPLYY